MTTPQPPTPPNQQNPAAGMRDPRDRLTGWAGTAWRGIRWHVNTAAWRAAETVWAYPVWAGVAVTVVVWATSYTVVHLAVTVATAVAVAFGTNVDATIRRKRIVSLIAVGHYRKRRRTVRRRWTEMWTNAGLVRTPTTPGGPRRMPALKGTARHRDGLTVYVAGETVAVGVTEVTAAARALTETVGAKSLRVVKPGVGRSPLHRRRDLLAVSLKFVDPFPGRPIRVEELPVPSGRGRVVIGLDEEGRGLEKSLALPSLVVGAPGSGKSSEVWTTLRALRLAGVPFRLRVFDPKGGLELGDLAGAAFRYESLPNRWPYFLAAACEALRVRQEIMRRMSSDRGRQVRKVVEPSEEFPLDLMLIDELVTVLAFSRGQDAKVRIWGSEMTAREAFTVYLSQIRASLASCIALSQLGEKQILGPARGMFPYISCLRVGPTEKELVDILLGQGAHNAYPAHELDANDPNMAGRGWVRTSEGVIAYRAAFMDDEERAAESLEIAAATARFRARGQRDPEVEEVLRRPKARVAGAAKPVSGSGAKPAVRPAKSAAKPAVRPAGGSSGGAARGGAGGSGGLRDE